MTSLSNKYERLKEILSELGINPSLPLPEQDLSLSLSQKRKAIELEPEAFQRVSDIHKVETETLLGYMVMDGNVRTLINQRFYVGVGNVKRRLMFRFLKGAAASKTQEKVTAAVESRERLLLLGSWVNAAC
ncbi:hypothetical protein Tco_0349037 [Tanacetum coccineum]